MQARKPATAKAQMKGRCLVLTGYQFKTGMTNSPVKGEIKTKKNNDINYWILAFASMTRR